jgi:hypothetical protein
MLGEYGVLRDGNDTDGLMRRVYLLGRYLGSLCFGLRLPEQGAAKHPGPGNRRVHPSHKVNHF